MAASTLYELCVDKVSKCVAKKQDFEALTIPVTVRKDLFNHKANTDQIEDYLFKLTRKIEKIKNIRSYSKTIWHVLRFLNQQNTQAFQHASDLISAICEFIHYENNVLMTFQEKIQFNSWNVEGLRRFSVGLEGLLDDVSEIHAHFKTEKRLLKDFYEDINPKFVIYTILS